MSRIAVFSHACVVAANREIFRELEREHEVLIVCPRRWRGSLIEDLEAGNERDLKAFPVAVSGNGSLFFYFSGLSSVAEFKPDYLFVDEEPWSLSALQVYIRFPGVKKVFYTKQNIRKALPAPFGMIQSFIFRRSAAAFAISAEAEEVLRWKGYAGEVFELPHSLNKEKFRRLSREEITAQRKRFGLPGGNLIGYFGRMTEEKGVLDLLEAAVDLISRGKDVKFVFCGNGKLAGGLRQASESYPGKIFSMPAVPHGEVNRLMACMDITVLPSRTLPTWKEQFGRVIIESAGCGVPVIGSDSGEIPKLIGKIGCGTSFPEGEVGALSERILELIENPEKRESFADRGSRAAAAMFHHGPVAETISDRLLALGR